MSHVYEAQTSDGKAYNVTTPHHHAEHDTKTFAQHLLDVIKQSGAQIAAGVIVHRFTHKGSK